MTKSKLFTAAALIAGLAVPAIANAVTDSSQGVVNVNATVAPRCLFTSPSATITLNEIAIQGSGATAGFLNTSAVDTHNATLTGWCNGTPSTMTVDATPLANTSFLGSPPTGFDRLVNYTATANNGAVSATDTSNPAGPGSPVNVNIFAHDISVTLSGSSTPNSGRLIAGSYQGTVTVTLAPNVSPPT